MKDGDGAVGRAGRQRRSRVEGRVSSHLDRLVDIKWGRRLRGLALRRALWAVGRVDRAMGAVRGRRGSRPSPWKAACGISAFPLPCAWSVLRATSVWL